MKRRIISLALALAMMLSVMPSAFAAGTEPAATTVSAPAASRVEFSDIAGMFYEGAARRWASFGVVSGDGAGKFAGQSYATRAQVAKIITLTLGYEENVTVPSSFYSSFTDVSRGAWYAPYLYSLNSKGIMQGDGAGKIRPDDSITRQEFLVMLGRAAGIVQNEGAIAASGLKGQEKVASWAKGFVGAMIERSVIRGDEQGNINADARITRGEIVTINDRLVSDYITAGGDYTLSGSGITVIKTASPVTVKADNLKGSVVVAETAGRANVTVSGIVQGAVLVNTNANVTLTGAAESINIGSGANGAYVTVKSTATASSIVNSDPKSTVVIEGAVESVTMAGGTVNVANGAKVEVVGVNGDNTTVSVSGAVGAVIIEEGTVGTTVSAAIGGSVGHVEADGRSITVGGSGSVGTVRANGKNIAVNTPGTDVSVGTDAENVTVSGKKVGAGEAAQGSGSTPSVAGGGPSGAAAGAATAATINKQPEGGNVNVSSTGLILSVEHSKTANQNYGYQWFVNDTNSNEGGREVLGATSARFTAIPDESLIGQTLYYYVVVTAYRGVNSAKTTSEAVPVYYATAAESHVNVFYFGGFTLGSYDALYTFGDMYKERYGVKVDTYGAMTGHTSTSSTYNIYELFASAARARENDYTFASTTVKTALDARAYDYVIIQTGKDLSITSASSRNQNILSAKKLVKLAADMNPNVKVIIVAPYAHTTGFKADFNRIGLSTSAGHASLINAEAGVAANEINKAGYTTDSAKVAYVSNAFINYANGNYDKMAEVLYRPDNGYTSTSGVRGYNHANRGSAAGAYLTAATIFATLTGESPVGLNTMGVTTNNSNLDNTSNAETAASIAASGETAKGLAYQLQQIAQKTALATQGETAEYTIQYYLWNDDAADYIYAPDHDEIQTGFLGMEKTVIGKEIKGYIEDTTVAQREATKFIEAEGTVFKLYYTNKAMAPVIITQPRDADERLLSVGALLTVEIDPYSQHTYEYQWYEADDAYGEGTEIPGATSATYTAPKTDEGVEKYYYAVVTAKFNTSGAETTSNRVKVTFSNYMNVFIFGGYTIGSYNSKDILANMFEEKGIDVRLHVITADHTRTWTTYNAHELMSGTTFASMTYSNSTMKNVAENIPIDVAFIQSGRDTVFSSASSKTSVHDAIRKISMDLALKNPEVQIYVLAPQSHTVGFDADFGSAARTITDYASHEAAINEYARDIVSAVNADGYAKNAKLISITDASTKFADGDSAKLSALYRPDNGVYTGIVRGNNYANRAGVAGAYLAAATIYGAVTGESPWGLETDGAEANDGMLSSTTNAETAAALKAAGMTAEEMKLELQATAEYIVFGTERERAEYTIERYVNDGAGTEFKLYDSAAGKAFAGVTKTVTAEVPGMEDYIENTAMREDTAVISANNDTVFRFYFDKLGDNAATPVISKDLDAQTTVKYLTRGKTLSVEIEEAIGNEYTYQWYKADSATNEGGIEIPGATQSSYMIAATDDNLDTTEYYYVVVTAHRKGNEASTASAVTAATYRKETLNIFIFGGFTPIVYYPGDTMAQMIREVYGVEVNLMSRDGGHAVTDQTNVSTFNIYEIFDGSTNSTDMNLKQSIGNATAVKALEQTELDFVIIESSKDFALTTASSKTYEKNAFMKVARYAALQNPDAQYIVLAPYAHSTGFSIDFSNASLGITNNATHANAINDLAVELKADVDSINVLNRPAEIVYVDNAFTAFANGSDEALKLLYLKDDGFRLNDGSTYVRGCNKANRADVAGAYLTGAALFAGVTLTSPVGIEYTGGAVTGTSVNNNVMTDARAQLLAETLDEDMDALVFDLQAAAEKAVLGTEPKAVEYSVEHWFETGVGTGEYAIHETTAGTGYVGKSVTVAAGRYEALDYIENLYHPDTVKTQVLSESDTPAFKIYYNKLSDEAIAPEFTKDLSTDTLTVKYLTHGKTINVEVEEFENNSYTYQWYVNDTNSTEGGTEIPGATGLTLHLDATDDNLDTMAYYYMVATATRKQDSKSTASKVLPVSYAKAPLNVFIFGGFTTGQFTPVYTMKEIMQEHYGVEINLFYRGYGYSGTGSSTPGGTFNINEIYTNAGSANIASKDLVLGDNAETKRALEQTELDFVITQSSKENVFTLAASVTSTTRAVEKTAMLVAERNPDAQYIILAPTAHTVGFAIDFASTVNGYRITDYASHVAAIEKEAEREKDLVNALGILNYPAKVVSAAKAFDAMAGGNSEVLKLLYLEDNGYIHTDNTVRGRNPANRSSVAGAYIVASALTYAITGEAPVGSACTGIDANNSNVMTDGRAQTLADTLGVSLEELIAKLQTAAGEAALG